METNKTDFLDSVTSESFNAKSAANGDDNPDDVLNSFISVYKNLETGLEPNNILEQKEQRGESKNMLNGHSASDDDVTAQNEELKEANKELMEKSLNLEGLIAKYETDLSNKMHDLLTKNEELDFFKEKLRILESENLKMKEKVSELSAEILQLKTLDINNNAEKAMISDLQREIQQKDKFFDKLKSELAEKNNQLKNFERDSKNLSKQLEDYKRILEQKGEVVSASKFNNNVEDAETSCLGNPQNDEPMECSSACTDSVVELTKNKTELPSASNLSNPTSKINRSFGKQSSSKNYFLQSSRDVIEDPHVSDDCLDITFNELRDLRQQISMNSHFVPISPLPRTPSPKSIKSNANSQRKTELGSSIRSGKKLNFCHQKSEGFEVETTPQLEKYDLPAEKIVAAQNPQLHNNGYRISTKRNPDGSLKFDFSAHLNSAISLNMNSYEVSCVVEPCKEKEMLNESSSKECMLNYSSVPVTPSQNRLPCVASQSFTSPVIKSRHKLCSRENSIDTEKVCHKSNSYKQTGVDVFKKTLSPGSPKKSSIEGKKLFSKSPKVRKKHSSINDNSTISSNSQSSGENEKFNNSLNEDNTVEQRRGIVLNTNSNEKLSPCKKLSSPIIASPRNAQLKRKARQKTPPFSITESLDYVDDAAKQTVEISPRNAQLKRKARQKTPPFSITESLDYADDVAKQTIETQDIAQKGAEPKKAMEGRIVCEKILIPENLNQTQIITSENEPYIKSKRPKITVSPIADKFNSSLVSTSVSGDQNYGLFKSSFSPEKNKLSLEHIEAGDKTLKNDDEPLLNHSTFDKKDSADNEPTSKTLPSQSSEENSKHTGELNDDDFSGIPLSAFNPNTFTSPMYYCFSPPEASHKLPSPTSPEKSPKKNSSDQLFETSLKTNTNGGDISDSEHSLVIAESVDSASKATLSDVGGEEELNNSQAIPEKTKKKTKTGIKARKKRFSQGKRIKTKTKKNISETCTFNKTLSIEDALEVLEKMKFTDMHVKQTQHTLVNALINPVNAPKVKDAVFQITNYLHSSKANPMMNYAVSQNSDILLPQNELVIIRAILTVCSRKKHRLPGLLESLLKTWYLLILTKTKFTIYGLSSLCRTLTELCKFLKDRRRPLMLCAELLKMQHKYAPYLIASVASVWKELFEIDNYTGEEKLFHSTIVYGIQKKTPELTNSQWKICKSVLKTFLTSPVLSDISDTVNVLIHTIQTKCESDDIEDEFLLTAPLVVIAAQEGWDWTKKNLVDEYLIPILVKYSEQDRNKKAFQVFCNLYTDVCFFCPEDNDVYQVFNSFFERESSSFDDNFVIDAVAMALIKLHLLKKEDLPIHLISWIERNKDDSEKGAACEELFHFRLSLDVDTLSEENIIV